MDAITQEVITWDMSHLTLQQVEQLHALKAVAIRQWIKETQNKIKGARNENLQNH